MRIAYVCADPGVPVFGAKGASVHVQEVLRVLVGAGAQVDLFCARVGGPRPAGLDGVAVHVLGPTRTGDLAERELACLAADALLADALTGAGPFDLVYERYALWSRAGTAYARRRGVPAVVEVNAPLVDEQARHRGLVHRAEAEAVIAEVARDAAALVCVSEPVARWVAERTGDRRRIRVVPNGVDTERILPAAEPPTGFTVGFLGTLKPWHGVEVLVDAVARLHAVEPDVRLLLVGDGPQATALRRRVEAAGLEGAVEMTGAVPPRDVPTQLHRMHVAVAPYPDDPTCYFSPLKVMEYFAAGLPVVASRIGQLQELVRDDHDGLLVPAGDVGALTHALAALRHDPARRRQLGTTARAAAVERHTWRQVVARSLEPVGVQLPAPAAAPLPLDSRTVA